jgi:Ca2+-binding RTX toxin-like protein
MAIYVYDGRSAYTGTAAADAFYMQDARTGLVIDGGGGNDYVRGGSTGNLFPDGDTIDGGDGTDYIYGGGGIDLIHGGAGDDFLSGAIDNGDGTLSSDRPYTGPWTSQPPPGDQIHGDEGNDTLYLDDLSGDVGYGGPGDDLYVLKLPDGLRFLSFGLLPEIVELPGEGVDTVIFSGGRHVSGTIAWPGHFTLPDNFEVLLLAEGGAEVDHLDGTGNGSDNTIIGNSFANLLDGQAGNDAINGAGGADDVRGGVGNDLLHGGDGDDSLYGGEGNDTLLGDGGNDYFLGGPGDDLYGVDAPGDSVEELAGEGYDEVYASVDFGLTDAIETLFLTGSARYATGGAGNNALIGNDAANILDGRGGNDYLRGQGGDDLLAGGAGFDELWGGAGADLFRLERFDDTSFIGDFTPGQDRLQVASVQFGLATITEGIHFFKGAAPFAQGTAPAFLYSTASGYLLFDGDGAGASAPIVVAILNGVPDLQVSDFTFY